MFCLMDGMHFNNAKLRLRETVGFQLDRIWNACFPDIVKRERIWKVGKKFGSDLRCGSRDRAGRKRFCQMRRKLLDSRDVFPALILGPIYHPRDLYKGSALGDGDLTEA